MSDDIIPVDPMDPSLENSPVSEERPAASDQAAAAPSSVCKHNSTDYSFGSKICMGGTIHQCAWDGLNAYWKDTKKTC